MWMLLIVKLLSFKRYNSLFTSAEKMNNKCNMFILSLLAIKLYRFFLAFFVRFWKQMQCIVSQPLPFLVLQNAYLVAKIQIYIGLEQTIILKNIIPQLLFSIILIAPLHVSSCCNLFRYKCNPYFYQLFVRLQFLYCANGL